MLRSHTHMHPYTHTIHPPTHNLTQTRTRTHTGVHTHKWTDKHAANRNTPSGISLARKQRDEGVVGHLIKQGIVQPLHQVSVFHVTAKILGFLDHLFPSLCIVFHPVHTRVNVQHDMMMSLYNDPDIIIQKIRPQFSTACFIITAETSISKCCKFPHHLISTSNIFNIPCK